MKEESSNEQINYDFDLDEDLPKNGSSEEGASKKLFEFSKEKKSVLIFYALIVFFLIFFTILFFCSYFIPRNEYLKAKEENPELEFFEMETTPVALYWTEYCIFVLCLLAAPLFLTDAPLIFIPIFFSVAALSFYIANAVYISVNAIINYSYQRTEYYTSYEDNITRMINELPYLQITWTGFSNNGRKRTTYYVCHPKPFIVNVTNATTSFYIPKEIGDFAWVQVRLNASYTPEVTEYVKNFSSLYRQHLPETDQNGYTIEWEDDSGYSMETYHDYIFLIQREKSNYINPHVAKTMMAFWSGIGYLYRLMAIPIYQPTVSKANINITLPEINESDILFDIISLTHCEVIKRKKNELVFFDDK
ncbi:hypothetical protein GPJ56_002249 [Histomonas meleagridis]|uniref:uncharacterized protein n=1 Tax=Histomonas meleagridis TaxID=135588 RepID=UPI0035595655|nr:hypothetical protein GPJ56_002249 [Histomonas meleagridis]KAH0802941.1 hypothetical protein GO595_004448 [Histomonas meleagridis]